MTAAKDSPVPKDISKEENKGASFKRMSSREARKFCWEKRDAYFACLDKIGEFNAEEDFETDGATCRDLRNEYRVNCVETWVKYFNIRRFQDHQKKQLYKYGKSIEQGIKDGDIEVNLPSESTAA